MDCLFAHGRKFAGATLASGLLLAAFLYVSSTGRGVNSFPEFVAGVVSIYGLFSGGNALATLAGKKGSE